MGEIIVKNKGFAFAVRVVNFYEVLTEGKDYILSKQLVRSGTSFGANVKEAINSQSKADFIHKSSISQKECDENMYRLELLKATNYISEKKLQA
ncbi:four helix bundle protein [Flavobacterium sp.]|jgi:four helix bundle protein|uniref:four helix bundle protein n=1 Tax=Flavobacterium sp. TaxID=239 RepID=UPI0037BE41D7